MPTYLPLAQSDVYLNDLVAVEYGSGTDFSLTFDQTQPFHFSTPTQGLRDEICWNLLTVRPRRWLVSLKQMETSEGACRVCLSVRVSYCFS